MTLFQQMIWRSQRLAHGRYARGYVDRPAPVSPGGRTLFMGWVSCVEPIASLVLDLDGDLHDLHERCARPDVPHDPARPHLAGWRVVVDVARSRRGPRRAARVLVNEKTAVTAAFDFDPALKARFNPTPDESSRRPEAFFDAAAAALPTGARVLEIGTRQAVDGTSTHNLARFPAVLRGDYVMCDVLPGRDVDVVGDLHALPPAWSNGFDAFVAKAVFEHLERPWIAAREVARVLKPGGLGLIGTHQCFPLHGYPQDFFRFSKEALSLLFADAGLRVVEAAYDRRASIVAPPDIVLPAFHDQWNATWPSYIDVAVVVAKPT